MIDKELGQAEINETLAHTQTCDSCKAVLDQYEFSQQLIKTRLGRLDAPAYLESLLWKRIGEKKKHQISPINVEQVGRFLRELLVPQHSWVRVVEVTAFFLLAVFAGIQIRQTWDERSQNQERTTSLSAPKAEKNFTKANYVQPTLPCYLEKSTIMLLQIQNGRHDSSLGSASLSEEKKLAKELLVESKIISRELANSKYRYLSGLVDELEPVFTEVAYFDPKQDKRSLEILRKAIRENDYLLKLQLAKSLN
jgi:hypothetical protein